MKINLFVSFFVLFVNRGFFKSFGNSVLKFEFLEIVMNYFVYRENYFVFVKTERISLYFFFLIVNFLKLF